MTEAEAVQRSRRQTGENRVDRQVDSSAERNPNPKYLISSPRNNGCELVEPLTPFRVAIARAE